MTPLRIGASDLETFRLLMDPQQDWLTDEMFAARLMKTDLPTSQMRVGSALDHILERPDPYRVTGGYVCDDYAFSAVDIDAALTLLDARGVPQVKGQKAYVDGQVVVVAVADRLEGSTLLEFKGSQSSYDVDKYLHSAQWKFMADIFEPARIIYRVFKLADHGNGVIEIQGMNALVLYPYPTLHEDCAQLAADFVAYATSRGLDTFLRGRQAMREEEGAYAA